MSPVQIAIYGVLGLALVVSVVTDLRTRKIKNYVTLPTMVVCLAARAVAGGWGELTGPGLFSGLAALAIGGLFFFVFARLGGMGMGDVKLVAAVGDGVSFPMILACLVCIGLAGGVQAVISLIWSGRLLATLGGMGRVVLRKARVLRSDAPGIEGMKIPYGVAIAVGTVWGVWWSLGQAAGAVTQ